MSATYSTTLLGCSLLWLANACVPAARAQDLVVHYFPRPPYVFAQGESLGGLTGAPTVAALQRAGVGYTLQETPASRFLTLVQHGEGLDCGVGWFRNPEREAQGKFSLALYQDESMAVLTQAQHPKLHGALSLAALLTDPGLTLLTKQSFSYGRKLDALIAQHRPQRQDVTTENLAMLKMIQTRRADYLFMAPEEFVGAVAAAGLKATDFALLRPSDMPKGETRHLWCSRAVPDSTVNRFNAGLR